jgi:GAF domain-containing protein
VEPVPETRKALEELGKYGSSQLAATLLLMGDRAREIVPECVGLSLGIVEDGLTFTLVATSDEMAVLDAMQYLDGGPCVTAVEEAEVLDVAPADLLDEDRWLMYASASAAVGVGSSLSLPTLQDGQVVGGINLYASTPDAFTGRHEELAIALNASAEGAVTNADLGFSTRRAAARVPERLADLHDIDVAVGIIAASQGVDLENAKARLEHAAERAGITEGQAARAVRHLRVP